MATDTGDCANHAWGYLATGVKDAADCISSCRENFLTQMIPANGQFNQLCEKLESGGRSSNYFAGLYCCDSQLCGVNHLDESGRDPNVNWLINSCQSLGYQSIVDPGPPAGAYTCGEVSAKENKNSQQCREKNGKVMKTTGVNDSIISQTTSTLGTSTTASQHETTITTSSKAEESEFSEPTKTDTFSYNPLNTSMVTADANEAEIWRPEGLTRGIKVTIGLGAFVAAMVICALIWWLCRERKRRKSKNLKEKFISPPSTGTKTVSRPVSQFPVPMTPPARLRERRLLPPLKHLEPTGEVDEGSDKEIPNFPESPVYAPTHYKLSPRRESFKMKRGSDPSKESRLPTVLSEKEEHGRNASIHLSASPTLDVSLNVSSPTFNPPILAPPALGTSVLSHSSTLNSPTLTSPGSSSPAAASSGGQIPSLLGSGLLNSSPLISPVIGSPAAAATRSSPRIDGRYETLIESGSTTPVPPPRNPAHHALTLSELVRPLPASMRERAPTPSETNYSSQPDTPPRKRQTMHMPDATLGNPSQDSVLTPEIGDHRLTGSSSRSQRNSW